MKIKILIVEDEGIIAWDIAERLKKNGYEIAGVADNGTDALQLAMDTQPDIALLDIHIKGETDGITLAVKMNELRDTPIIYATALSDRHTVERARLTFPYAYLIKPFRDIDLFNAIELAFRNAARKAGSEPAEAMVFTMDDRVFIRTGNASFEKVMLDDIQYIEADRSYCRVVTANAAYTLSSSLSAVLQSIHAAQIIRVHKSYAVNIKNVAALKDNKLYLYNIQVPVGAGYQQHINALFNFVK